MSRLILSKPTDADSLIKLHEELLFLRAYPANKKVLKQVEKKLSAVRQQVARLRNSGKDLSRLDEPEFSGIADTVISSNFSYGIVRRLVAKYPTQISIDWDWFDEEDRFGATMPRFVPLLEEDALVEAHVPYREWLRNATGRKSEVAWLIRRFESLKVSDKRKAELYDSLKLHVIWRFGFRSSRTGLRLSVRNVFFHRGPLLQRRDVLLADELNSPSIAIGKLSRTEGEKILDLARETSAVRYRELHGFTHGDARRVIKAHLGRGVDVFVFGVPAENRLPLRAYHAAIIFKNGIPVAYFEGLSLCERMESGFNLYYTFREGETAWLYARILRLMRQLLGVTIFSIDPYQIGHENDEGIESGAFWFYRKLGFRPVKPNIARLTEVEEQKIANNKSHRSSAATLKRLAAGQMAFELSRKRSRPSWDNFEARKIGLRVQHRMAREFNGESTTIRAASVDFVKEALEIRNNDWTAAEQSALDNLSLPLAMIPNLGRWSTNEKALAVRVIRAKASADEALYLKLMQKSRRLRAALIRLGS